MSANCAGVTNLHGNEMTGLSSLHSVIYCPVLFIFYLNKVLKMTYKHRELKTFAFLFTCYNGNKKGVTKCNAICYLIVLSLTVLK